jgi:LysM repeat protein
VFDAAQIKQSLINLMKNSMHAMSTGDPMATADYRVHQGDTLWSIATDTIAPGEDVRGAVAAIQELNGLSTSLIEVGDVLLVPVSDDA